ncbi:organomercurial lyase MerB [Sphingopyxis sp. SE2]|uniref:organomercurial lyase MerB n=1 Tax=Sphingopyxis sp. SE2 TaxID=1586240 RepID=UPI0028C21A65|nr:organomercurial lyase MerB [Sphingopyxis sp. SE2]MDT7531481.1 organomercurial lyase MerB [Sphingopyxis sp. SE2]
MKHTRYITEIAESLTPANQPEGFGELFVVLLRELAKGRPVSRTTLAITLDWPAERVNAVLERTTSTEYDNDGNIVGHVLTLRETSHIFEIDGRRLYAWCALDTLMFPALIGQTARVSSHCAATGAPVSLTISPNEIQNVVPADAVVSLVLPQATADIRQSFCCHVHFFASVVAAKDWASKREGVEIASVQDAFRLGQELNRHLLQTIPSRKS